MTTSTRGPQTRPLRGNGWVMRELGEKDRTWFYALPGAPTSQRLLVVFGTTSARLAVFYVLGAALVTVAGYWGEAILVVVALFHSNIIAALLKQRMAFSRSFAPDPPGTAVLQRYWAACSFLRACAEADEAAHEDLLELTQKRDALEAELYAATPYVIDDLPAWTAATRGAAAIASDAVEKARAARRRVDGRLSPQPRWGEAGMGQIAPLVLAVLGALAAVVALATTADPAQRLFLITALAPALGGLCWVGSGSLRRKRQVQRILAQGWGH